MDNIGSIEFTYNCHSCGGVMDQGEDCYCVDCINKKDDEISGLQKKVDDLETEMVVLKENVNDVEIERDDWKKKVEEMEVNPLT